VRKAIIIISVLFLFSIITYAQPVQKNGIFQEEDAAYFVTDDSAIPEAQKSVSTRADTEKRPPVPPPIEKQKQGKPVVSPKDVKEVKQIKQEAEHHKTPVQKEQMMLSSKSESAPSGQNALSPGSETNVKPVIPPPQETVTIKTLIPRGSISLNFDDADIYSVIQTVFSEILKVNYIIDPKVKGRVTFRRLS